LERRQAVQNSRFSIDITTLISMIYGWIREIQGRPVIRRARTLLFSGPT